MLITRKRIILIICFALSILGAVLALFLMPDKTEAYAAEEQDPTVFKISCGGDYGFSNGPVTITNFLGTTQTEISSYMFTFFAYSKEDYPTEKDFNKNENVWDAESTTARIDGKYYNGFVCRKEGNYGFCRGNDLSNYSSFEVYYFTIDKSAPTLTLSGVSDGGYTNNSVSATLGSETDTMLANSKDVLTVKYSYSTVKNSFPSVATTVYKLGTTLSADGHYLMTIADKAGNSTSYTFTIDRTAPQVENAFEYANRTKYTNDLFVFSVSDAFLGVDRIDYLNPSGARMTTEHNSVSVPLNKDNFGKWQFQAYDSLGNATGWYSVILFKRDTYGNIEEIKNSYKVSTWYTVTLPAKIYTNIAGTYSFATYQEAFTFSMTKEKEYRVEELSGGRYSYVNIANESVAQVYNTYEELETVMKKYAATYISDRRALSHNGSTVTNPTDDKGVTRPDALTRQELSLPAELSEYSDIPLYLVKHDFIFALPQVGVAGNKIISTIRFIHDGVNKQSGKVVSLEYSQPLETMLKAANAWHHGYYLVTEQDLCGNIEKFLIFIDTELPVLKANVEYGTGEKEDIEFNEFFISENANLLRYISVDLNSIYDAVDEYALIYINGRKLNEVIYAQGDELPCLNYENGYWGSYKIIVYDRSFNCLIFTLRIAGEEISVNHSSLTNEVRCTLTVVNGDSNNAIVSISLFKVSYTGEEMPLYMDDDGTPVSPENLLYIIRTGGKYIVRITDIFGRVSETGPLFYMKGLPSGILKGVKDGGITKSDVKFTFSADCSVILYAWQGGNWVENEDALSISIGENSSIASITASASNSRLFKFFLYVTDDMNLFTEYQFEIDCIPPAITVFTNSGGEVQPDSVIRHDFYVDWKEANVSMIYYRQENPLGSLGATKYIKGDVFSLYGTYVFEARDIIGNVTSFTITLDNIVSYKLEGTYSELEDGTYIAKSAVTLTITEKTSSFVCRSNNGIEIANGQAIAVDGTYHFVVCDLYGNTLELTVIIDVLPPVPIITTVDGISLAPNSSTNSSFWVACEEENVQISFSMGSGGASSYTGEMIEEEGIYTFKMLDRLNNAYEFTVIIDKKVSFSIGGKGTYILIGDNCYLSQGNIFLILKEDFTSFEVSSEQGNTIKPGELIKLEDVYTVSICDTVGNRVQLTLIIDQTAPTPIITAEDGSLVDYNGMTNLAFNVSCDEEDALIEWKTKDGAFIAYRGEECRVAGSYYFRLTDRIGNTATYFVTIDRNVNYSISGTYSEYANHTYATRSWLKLSIPEDYSAFVVSSERGNTFLLGETIRAEDVYTVYIRDAVGNDVQLTLIVDFSPPEIDLFSDLEINAKGATRGSVTVSVSDYLTASYSLNGYVQNFTDKVFLEEEGLYTITAKDHAGNTTIRTFSIDKSVDVTLSKTVLSGQFITEAVTFTFNEAMGEIALIANGEALAFKGGTIKEVGKYELKASDLLGNTVEYFFEILPRTSKGFVLVVPDGYTVSVSLEGSIVNVLEGNVLHLESDGNYLLDFFGDNGEYKLNLSVDTVAPTAEIIKSRNQITIASLSKENVTVEIYRNGKRLNYVPGKSFTEKGTYRVVLTDAYGNVNTYELSLNYINAAGIACIVIACSVIAMAVVAMIFVRKKQGVR